ncbi:response regulator [Sphingosinithalassobacter portus]|uniref:response regulator n=1 Tax=Stakelama portus TaxID=2676234 RepID=UPI001EFC90F1|nr:response regulator [Sphingosinithalassobacter portus]
MVWRSHLWVTQLVADALIALAFSSIALALVIIVRRRANMQFGLAFWCFAAFILACGITHAIAVVTLWYPAYGFEALVKVATALASVVAAYVMWRMLPRMIALPAAGKLQEANDRLQEMVVERDAALAELRAEIGNRERAEAALLQLQKLEAVGQLTGGIAHDFNNLLQAVAGNLELIARKPDDIDRIVRWAGSALDAVDRGRSLTSQLLAFSRKQRLEIAPVELRGLIIGVRELVERAVSPISQLEIAAIDPALFVETDPMQLELALLNLAFNARDAMPQGGVMRISARALPQFQPPGLSKGDWVAITVADTGIGMDAETREHAIEPFFSTKEIGEGTGMGLAMVYGVVTQSGGGLDIDSAPGAGTRITLYLRAAKPSLVRASTRQREDEPVFDLSGRTIVLVDDDKEVRTALAETLTAAGARVEQAPDGSSGATLVAERQPDLLIVDFAMPRMNGAEVAERVREMGADMPILVITGFSDSQRLDAIDGKGFSILRKPFETRELLQRITALLDS